MKLFTDNEHLADLANVDDLLDWDADTIDQEVDWFFVWYTDEEGPFYSKAPPLDFGFSLDIINPKTHAIVCTISKEEDGWDGLSMHLKQFWVYAAIPRAKWMVKAIRGYEEGK